MTDSRTEQQPPDDGDEGDRPELTVVIPAYNEQATIADILDKVLATPHPKEVLVVDDGSADDTPRLVQEYADRGVRLIQHEQNQGKGAALQTGFKAARGEIILIQDADLEYDPENYDALLAPIRTGRADVVYGSRFLGGPHRVLYFWHFVANKLLTTWSNMVSNLNFSDMETGYKVFRREVVSRLELKEKSFGIEPEMTQKVARGNWRMFEVPISYYGRTYEEGKKIGMLDAVRAFWCVLKYRFFD
jgi:glycosyltransferase involved in cell wall biosynthesis